MLPWPWAGAWRRRIAGGRQEPFDLAGSAVYVLGLGLLLHRAQPGPGVGLVVPATIGCLLLAGLSWRLGGAGAGHPHPDDRPPPLQRRAFSAPMLSAMLCYANISATASTPRRPDPGRELSPWWAWS